MQTSNASPESQAPNTKKEKKRPDGKLYKTVEKTFNVKKPFWKSMGTVFDLFVLNIMWVICSIPLITIGPATTAAYYALIQRARNEQTELHKDFFRSFKRNMKQGILLGILLGLVGGFLAMDMYLCRKSGTGIYSFFLFFFAVFFLFWTMTTLYAFPIMAKFERSIKEILIWAFTLSIKNILMTGTMLFVIVSGLYMCKNLPGLLFIMFGLLFQFCATIFASIFKPYLPKPWYMEEEEDLYDFNPKPFKFSDLSESTPDETGGYESFVNEEAALYGYDPAELEKLLNESDSNK